MSKNTFDIKSYEDLQTTRKNLRINIQEQEQSFKEHPIIKIADSIHNKDSIGSTIFGQLPEIKFGSGEKLISSFLLSNKVTRKYFAGYLVAKEMVPYIIDKVKSIVNSKEKSIKEQIK